MQAVRAKVTVSGRLSLPADVRRAVGLEHGGDVVVELAGKEIRIRTLEEVVARAQQLARQLTRGKAGTSVEDFLEQRRQEAQRDA